jgi:hypothetical protein
LILEENQGKINLNNLYKLIFSFQKMRKATLGTLLLAGTLTAGCWLAGRLCKIPAHPVLTSFQTAARIADYEPELKGVDIMESFHEAAAITEYRRDERDHHPENTDYWQSPEETARLKKGDCEDKSFYLQDLLRKEGFHSDVVLGILETRNKEGRLRRGYHAWVETVWNGETYILDPARKLITLRSHPARKREYIYTFGHPKWAAKLIEYKQRNGITRPLTKHYDRDLRFKSYIPQGTISK